MLVVVVYLFIVYCICVAFTFVDVIVLQCWEGAHIFSMDYRDDRQLILLITLKKQVQMMSTSEVPTDFHAKDAQFLAEKEFMQVCCCYELLPSSPDE